MAAFVLDGYPIYHYVFADEEIASDALLAGPFREGVAVVDGEVYLSLSGRILELYHAKVERQSSGEEGIFSIVSATTGEKFLEAYFLTGIIRKNGEVITPNLTVLKSDSGDRLYHKSIFEAAFDCKITLIDDVLYFQAAPLIMDEAEVEVLLSLNRGLDSGIICVTDSDTEIKRFAKTVSDSIIVETEKPDIFISELYGTDDSFEHWRPFSADYCFVDKEHNLLRQYQIYYFYSFMNEYQKLPRTYLLREKVTDTWYMIDENSANGIRNGLLYQPYEEQLFRIYHWSTADEREKILRPYLSPDEAL